jgi:hypothetical protein
LKCAHLVPAKAPLSEEAIFNRNKAATEKRRATRKVQHKKRLSYGPPWANYLSEYWDHYSVGPWDYSACATWHLMVWGARTTVEKYADRKLYMSCTV